MSVPSDPLPASGPDAILLDGVSFRVAGHEVLSDITLRLTERRIGLIGRNGSGKTTLLRLIAGLVAPSSGRVRIGAVDPFAERKAALGQVGILFQNPDHQILFPYVEEELAFGLRQGGLSNEAALHRAQAVLDAWGRSAWARVPVQSLSQGQRQMVCLMAVLAMAPETLLLDEPYASLDLPARMRLARRLHGLEQRVIVISHDPEALAGMERVIWLDAGRIRRDGPAGGVLPEFAAEMAQEGARDADADLAG